MFSLKSRDIYSLVVAKGWLPWGAFAPVLALLMVVVTALAGDALLELVLVLDAKGNPVNPTGLIGFTTVPFGLLLLLLLAWVRFVERRPLASIGLVGDHKARAFLRGHMIGWVSMLVIVTIILWTGGYAATGSSRAWASPAALASIVLLLFSLALQSSAEEILFRGWLLSVVSKKFSVAMGVLVSSALFALLHFSRGQHWLVTVSNFLFGVFGCCWALRSKSILGVMGWHSGWNWLLAVGFGLPLSGIDVNIPSLLIDLKPVGANWLTGGAQGPEASVVCIAYFVVASVWMVASARNNAAVGAHKQKTP